MDINTLVTALGGVAVAAGSFYGGRKTLKVNDSTLAVNTVDLLNTQLELLRTENGNLREVMDQQNERIKVLESMVTQRAEVELVKETVMRIEAKLNAQA